MFGKSIRKYYGIGIMALLVAAIIGWGVTGAQAQSQTRFPLSSPVATNAKTSLHDQPVADSSVTKALPANARGIVLGGPFNEGWYWLDFSGTKGYALGKALVLVDDKYTPVPEGTPPAIKTPVAEPTGTSVSIPPTATPTPRLGLG